MTCSELKVMQIDTMQPGLLKRDFSHGCAAVNKILTDIARRAVPLRQRSLLLSIIFAVVNQGPTLNKWQLSWRNRSHGYYAIRRI